MGFFVMHYYKYYGGNCYSNIVFAAIFKVLKTILNKLEKITKFWVL